MNAIATGMWCGLAPVTENIDMSTPYKSGVAFRALRPLVLAIGLLAGLSGTAVAQTGFCQGEIDFCDNQIIGGLTKPKWYDNAQPPTYGCFTDLPHSGWRPSNTNTITFRPPEINVYQGMKSTTATPPNPLGVNPFGDSPDKPWPCGLNFYGDSQLTSNGKAEMWITIVSEPDGLGTIGANAPKTDSWTLTATVWYDNVTGAPNPRGTGGWNNSKAVGIVTNYDTVTKKGLFLGMFDAGITETMQLLLFDASPDAQASPRTNIDNPEVLGSNDPAVGRVGMCKPTTPLAKWPTCAIADLKNGSISSRGDGGSVVNSKAYVISLKVESGKDPRDPTGPDLVSATASVYPATDPPDNTQSCPGNPSKFQQCLVYNGRLPAGVPAVGAVGIATLAPTSGAGIVDTYVSKFSVTPGIKLRD